MNCKSLGIAALLLVASLTMAHTAAAQNATNRPLIRSVVVDVDTDTLFINGLRFEDTPRFALFGLPDGSIVRLTTPFWSNTAITADLPTSEPGNYKLVIITGNNKRDQMGVTIVSQPSPLVVEWRYVGLTTNEDDGNIEFGGLRGVAAMNKMCAAEYGPGARAASIPEAYFRDDLSSDPRNGWLGLGGAFVIVPQPGSGFIPVDAATGLSVGSSFADADLAATLAYCGKYASPSNAVAGPITSGSDGRIFVSGGCNQVRPVACSAPVAIPVAP